ncbi:hypothetical protein LL038_03010 [Clostridium estertheticum]|uniref:Uncharacterized protein n=2 Tax=Clostridium estertheticum TaxID=238834 RepID=A0AA47ELI6_9CLOT|nr:hypothetical protein [Clostridium estertheticum]WAG61236.1 hypothetical protein LL038_03010 [Clostridium estertheticum]
MAKQYHKSPSSIIGLKNDYEAFCFDEACTYILNELSQEKPKAPNWEESKKHEENDDNKNTIEWMMKNSKAIN